jgi:flagellar basal body-associated protein FliL
MAAYEDLDVAVEERSSGSGKTTAIVAVICLALGGAGGFFGAGLTGETSGGGAGVEEGSEPTTISDLGEFTINLRNTAGGRVLQMKISAETTESAAAQIATRTPEIRDAILMMASDYTIAQLDGEDNRLAFRDEIEIRLDTILGPDQVERIYFTDFVVQ